MVAEDRDHKAKTVRNLVAKVVKPLAMMAPLEAETPTAGVDAFSNGISVNASPAMTMLPMLNKKTAKMVPMATIVVHESHASAHAIDQIRIEAESR